jgi:integrase
MADDISSKKFRANLAPRREPYWARIEAGLFVGYRAMNAGTGTWIARQRGDDGKQRYRALGTHETYDAAVKEARSWAKQRDQGVEVFTTTIDDACHAYVDHLRLHNSPASAKDAEGRFNRLVYGKPFGRILLSKLQTTAVSRWLADQVGNPEDDDDDEIRRSKDSANRNLRSLKAALNHALKGRLVATDAGWKTVSQFRDVGRRREHILTMDERKALLGACPDDLRRLAAGLLLTAARPGELAGATAADFNANHGTLDLDGKTGRRTMTLSSAARSFIAEQSAGKIGKAPIFVTAWGAAWTKDSWKKSFKTAAKKAGLPDSVVLYSLRHAAISEMLLSGLSPAVVSMLSGTSPEMIAAHYGHLLHDQTRALLDQVAVL